jgi:WD40 repeat protein
MSDLSWRARPTLSAVLLILLAACGSAPQARHSGATSTPSDSSEPIPYHAGEAKSLLFVDPGGLWFYSIGAADARRVVEDPSQHHGLAMRTATEASYFDENTLRTYDSNESASHTLLTVFGGVTLDWNPDGKSLAYLTQDDNEKGSSVAVFLYTPGGQPRRLWTSRAWGGRGGTQLDEISIAWSPDGDSLLIVVTPLDTALEGDTIVTADTIYVVRTDGSQPLKPRLGTMARWSADGRSIYYRHHGPSGAWRVMSVADGDEKALGLPSEAYRPRVSPDGTKIAFDDGREHPSLFVFDITSGTTRLIGKDYVAPVWLSATSLAAGKTTVCGRCEGAQWKPADGSTRWEIDAIGTPTATSMPIGSIAWGADAFLA